MPSPLPLPAETILERLGPLLTEERKRRIDEVIAGRTRTVVPVIDGLANQGNVNAVMRTAEALGFQQLHVIERGMPHKSSARTSQGAEKWLDLNYWDDAAALARSLREDGYRILATHLDETAVPISEVDFTRKTALVFGNELAGLSPEMLALSDQRVIVPMSGFVQSFNISVAAAISLYHARHDRLTRQGHHGDLSDREKLLLRASYYIRSVQNARRILEPTSGHQPRD
jgi:tRNA (guanosine-2'-O-)-methyltransferase